MIRDLDNKDGFWDRIGLWLSGVCAIHCLMTPIIVAVLPIGSNFFDLDSWTHWILGALLVPTVLIGIRSSIKNGRPSYIRSLFFGGGLLVVLGLLAGEFHSHSLESVLTFIGSIVLVAGHWKNWRD